MIMARGYEPFSYVGHDNIDHLRHVLLLRRAEPRVIAVVIDRLAPHFAAELVARLPVEVKDEVLLRLRESRLVAPEDLIAIDFAVRTNMDILSEAAGRMVPLEAS